MGILQNYQILLHILLVKMYFVLKCILLFLPSEKLYMFFKNIQIQQLSIVEKITLRMTFETVSYTDTGIGVQVNYPGTNERLRKTRMLNLNSAEGINGAFVFSKLNVIWQKIALYLLLPY